MLLTQTSLSQGNVNREWKEYDDEIRPVTTDVSAAQATLLKMICCGCGTNTDDPCVNRCICRRHGIGCTVLRKHCCELTRTNVAHG